MGSGGKIKAPSITINTGAKGNVFENIYRSAIDPFNDVAEAVTGERLWDNVTDALKPGYDKLTGEEARRQDQAEKDMRKSQQRRQAALKKKMESEKMTAEERSKRRKKRGQRLAAQRERRETGREGTIATGGNGSLGGGGDANTLSGGKGKSLLGL